MIILLHTGVHDPANLVVTADDATLLTVTRGPVAGNHLRVSIRALKRGWPVLQVRQGSAAGPILAMRAVDEFTVDTTMMQDLVINGDDRNATGIITMRPFIPDLRFSIAMKANRSSFADGGGKQTGVTDNFVTRIDPITGELVGDYFVELLIPAGETQFCTGGTMTQANLQDVPVANWGSINGHGCEAFIEPARLV